MGTNIISFEETLNHLEKRISNTLNCKKEIIYFLNWMITWNKDRSQNNQAFCFLREFEKGNREERVNVAFALDRDGNRLKVKRPNFFVIKLADTDREFSGFHVDFDLTVSGYPQLSQHLIQRDNNLSRWVALCSEVSNMGFDNFQRLFLVAYNRKGGIA